MVTNFAADLIEGKSVKESAQDTWQKRYDILADAAAMSPVNVATEAVVAPKCFTAYVKEVQTKETEETVSVYNLEVDDFHTYYVGSLTLCQNVHTALKKNTVQRAASVV